MKNLITVLCAVIVVIMTACTTQDNEVTNKPVAGKAVYRIPALREWDITLSSPVKEEKTICPSLPKQVLEYFPDSLLERKISYVSIAGLKIRNKLPGDQFSACVSAVRATWPLDGTRNVYAISYQNQLIAMWLKDSVTLRCKRLEIPTGEERPLFVDLPKFDREIEWTWSFSGLPYDAKDLAIGRVTEHSSQNGYTWVKTLWAGGGKYKLDPKAATRISVAGKTVYSD